MELRTLNAQDIFPVCTIIHKIGLNEIKACFEGEDIKKLIAKKGNESLVGMGVMLEIANIILKNMAKIENDLYSLLASLTGGTVDEIKNMDMVNFFELIVDVIKKPEFKDFFRVVSRLFTPEK